MRRVRLPDLQHLLRSATRDPSAWVYEFFPLSSAFPPQNSPKITLSLPSMSKLIVVTGATGQQGGSVVDTFLSLPGWRVRGLTRDPSSPAAKALASRGVEVVQADLDDTASLLTAFHGTNIIFLVTDYWASISIPANHALASAKGIPIRELAFDIEVQHGSNAARAASDPSILATLNRFIFSSLANMHKWTNGALKEKNHFTSKAAIESHILTQIPSLGAKLSTVQLGFYFSNWKSSPVYAPTKLAEGRYVYRTPFQLTTKMPWVDVSCDTGKFVKILAEVPVGTHILGVSSFGTFADLMDVFGRVHGVEAHAEHVAALEFFANMPMPDDLREVLIQLTDFTDGYGWTGGDPRIKLPWDVDPSLKTVSMEEYVREEDWSSLL